MELHSNLQTSSDLDIPYRVFVLGLLRQSFVRKQPRCFPILEV